MGETGTRNELLKMLWTDRDFINTADLLSVDPEMSEIAAAENMVLEGSNSVCRRGIEEAGAFLERKLVNFGSLASSGDLSLSHLAAVFNTGGHSTQRRKFSLEQVVVSGRNSEYWSEIKTWVAVTVLCVAYRTAMNRSSNDRYEHKYDRFGKMLREQSWPTVKKLGIPILQQPLPSPEAIQGFNPGTFSAADVSGSGNAGEWSVAVTYVDSTKYVSSINPVNGESHPSVEKIVTTASSEVIRVDITNLNPPTGVLQNEARARGFSISRKATHWNVYAGPSGGAMTLQNSSPISLDTKTYTLAGDPSTTGKVAGLGQYPEAYLTIMDSIQRS